MSTFRERVLDVVQPELDEIRRLFYDTGTASTSDSGGGEPFNPEVLKPIEELLKEVKRELRSMEKRTNPDDRKHTNPQDVLDFLKWIWDLLMNGKKPQVPGIPEIDIPMIEDITPVSYHPDNPFHAPYEDDGVLGGLIFDIDEIPWIGRVVIQQIDHLLIALRLWIDQRLAAGIGVDLQPCIDKIDELASSFSDCCLLLRQSISSLYTFIEDWTETTDQTINQIDTRTTQIGQKLENIDDKVDSVSDKSDAIITALSEMDPGDCKDDILAALGRIP